MKKTIALGTLLMATLMFALPGSHAQQQSTETQQPQGGWYCPWMSAKMQGGGGWCCPWGGKGGGMRYHHGRGMMSQYAPQSGKQLTQDEAKTLLQDYLKATGNPNLKLGAVADKEGFYEAEIVTKDGSLADKIQVNKDTGWFRSAY